MKTSALDRLRNEAEVRHQGCPANKYGPAEDDLSLEHSWTVAPLPGLLRDYSAEVMH